MALPRFKKQKLIKYGLALLFILLLFLLCSAVDVALGIHEWSYFLDALTNPTYTQALHTLDYLQEAMSEMLTTVLSFTFFIPSYATSNLSPHMIYRFLRDDFFLKGVGVFTISNVVFVVVKHTASDQFVPREGLFFSVFLMIIAMMMLPWFLFNLFAFLDIAKVVTSTISHLGTICQRIGHESDPKKLADSKEEILITLERLTDTGTKVFAWKGKGTCAEIVDAVYAFCITYSHIKRRLDESWFVLQIKNVHLLDSFALSETEIDELSASRSWVEYISLWHMHSLYMTALRSISDLCHLVAINVRAIAENAANNGDAPVVDMCILYFNTQLRCAINAGQPKVYNQVLHEYCCFAQNLMGMKDMFMSSTYTRSRRLDDFRENEDRRYILPKEMFQERVVRICGYIRYYGQLALQLEGHAILTPTANEFASLCLYAFRHSVECHGRVLDVFLRLGVEDDGEIRGFSGKSERCVAKAKIAVAAHYVCLAHEPSFPKHNEAQGYAEKILKTVEGITSSQFEAIYRELMISEKPDIGEAEERAAEHIVYLSVNEKSALQDIKSRFSRQSLRSDSTLSESVRSQAMESGDVFQGFEKPTVRRNSFAFDSVKESAESAANKNSNEEYEFTRMRPLKRSLSQSSFDLKLHMNSKLAYYRDSGKKNDTSSSGKSLELNTLTLTYSGEDRDKWVVSGIVLFIVVSVWMITLTLDSVTGSRPLLQTLEEIITQPMFQVRSSISRLGETMAVQLIIILTATGLLLNMASARFTPFALRIFYDDKVVKAVGGLCTFCQVFHILTNFFVVNKDYPKTAAFIGISSLGFVVWILIPFFAYMFNFLSPITVIDRVQRREQKYVKAMAKRATESGIRRAQEEAIRAIEQLADLANYALDKKDKETVSKLMETLCQKTIDYGAKKRTLPDDWFSISLQIQQSLDFVTIQQEDIEALFDRKNWYEWKVGRQYQFIFESALVKLKDICCVIAICTRRIAEDSINRRDYHSCDTMMRLFNTYIQLSLEKGEVRTLLYTISQYRSLCEFLLKVHSKTLLEEPTRFKAAETEDHIPKLEDRIAKIEDSIAKIARLFRNYTISSLDKKLKVAAEVIADDLASLTKSCYEEENLCYIEFLDILLNIDGGPEYRQGGLIDAGIRRVFIRHALFHYIQKDMFSVFAIVKVLKTQPKEALRQDWIDLTTLESSEYWEVRDRTRSLDYIAISKRVFLAEIYTNFLHIDVRSEEQIAFSLEKRLSRPLFPPMVSVREWKHRQTITADPYRPDGLLEGETHVDNILAGSSTARPIYQHQRRRYMESPFKLQRTVLQTEAIESQNKGAMVSFLQQFLSLFGLPLLAAGLFFFAFAMDQWIFGTPISVPLESLDSVVTRRRLTGVGELNMKLLVIIFTASPVLLQISTVHFSPVVVPLFLRSRVVVCTMAFMVISNLFLLLCNISIPYPKLTDWTLSVAVFFVGMVVNVMFPYHAYLLDFVRPNQIIRRITKNGLQALESIHPSKVSVLRLEQVQQSQLLFILSVDRLADIALRALYRHEKNVAFLAVEALWTLSDRYSEVKQDLPKEWFKVQFVHNDPDFVTMHDEFNELLQMRCIWVEWKILRQFQNLFSDSIKQIQDLCYLIGIKTRRIAESAATKEDVHALLLSIRFFNTFLRYSLNHGEIRGLNVTMHQYSKCAIKLIDRTNTSTDQETADQVEIGRAVILIASFFKYYASQALEKKMHEVVGIAAHDMYTVVEFAHTKKSPCHDELFRIFIELGRDEQSGDLSDGAIRAQMKLASHYTKTNDPNAAVIAQSLSKVPHTKLLALWTEFLSYTTSDIWELNDRGTNFNFLTSSEKIHLAAFLSRFPELAGKVSYDKETAIQERNAVDNTIPVVRITRRISRRNRRYSAWGDDDNQTDSFIHVSPTGGMGHTSASFLSRSQRPSFSGLNSFTGCFAFVKNYVFYLLTLCGLLSSTRKTKIESHFHKISSLENRPFGYIFTDRFRRNLYIVIVLVVVISFIIDISIDMEHKEQNSAVEVGGLGEIMAVILTVVLVVTATFVNIAAGRFTPAVTSLFLYNPSIHLMLSFFVVGTFYIMFVDFTVGEPTSSARTLFISIFVANISVILLIPYFSLLFSMLDPPRVIGMILDGGLTFINARSADMVQNCQAEVTMTIERLSNLASKVMQFNEKNMSFTVIDALGTFCSQYGDYKEELHPEWFNIKEAMRQNPDFISLSNDAIGNLVAQKLWVEWKTFRHFQIIFSSAMGNLPDMCNLIGYHVYKITKLAVSRGDFGVLDLSIKFMNTFLRTCLTKKDASAAQAIFFFYRTLTCYLVRAANNFGPTARLYLSRKVIQINDFLVFYGGLFSDIKLPQATHNLSYEISSICEISRRYEFEHEVILGQFIKFALNMRSINGVLRCYLKLATWYLANGYKEDAERMVKQISETCELRLLVELCNKIKRQQQYAAQQTGNPSTHGSLSRSETQHQFGSGSIQEASESMEINDPGFRSITLNQVSKLDVLVEMISAQYQESSEQRVDATPNSDDEAHYRTLSTRNRRIQYDDLPSSSGLGLSSLSTSQLIPSEYLYLSSSTSTQGRAMHAYDAKFGGRSAIQVLSVALPIISLFLIVPVFAGVRASNIVQFTNTIAFKDEDQLISSLARLGEQHSEKTRFMFMVTLTAAQSACLRYSGTSALYLIVNPKIFMTLLWIVTAVVLHVSLTYFVMEVSIPNAVIYMSVLWLCISLLMMFPYFVYMLQQMVPIKLVKRITEACTRATDLSEQELGNKDLVYSRQQQLFDAVEGLSEFGLKAIQMGDKSVFTMILEAYTDIALTYGLRKAHFVDTMWSRTRDLHRYNFDYLAMNKMAYMELFEQNMWFEWKVMRQLLMLFAENVRSTRDHPHTLSLTLYKIAIGAADREDFSVLDLSFRFLNTFIRIGTTAGDTRTVAIVLDKYRQLGEYLVHLSSPGNMRLFVREDLSESERVDLRRKFEKRVIRIANNFKYYMDVFRRSNQGSLVEVAALDLGSLVQRAYDASCESHRRLLFLFLKTTQGLTNPAAGGVGGNVISTQPPSSPLSSLSSPDQSNQSNQSKQAPRGRVLRGVRHAQIHLALHYLAKADSDYAWIVAEHLQEESRDRFESIVREMQTRQSSTHWEIFVYRSASHQLSISQCSHVPTLMYWVALPAGDSDPDRRNRPPPPSASLAPSNRALSIPHSAMRPSLADSYAFLPVESVYVIPLKSPGSATIASLLPNSPQAHKAKKHHTRRSSDNAGSGSSANTGVGASGSGSGSGSGNPSGSKSVLLRTKSSLVQNQSVSNTLPEFSNPAFTTATTRLQRVRGNLMEMEEDSDRLFDGLLRQGPGPGLAPSVGSGSDSAAYPASTSSLAQSQSQYQSQSQSQSRGGLKRMSTASAILTSASSDQSQKGSGSAIGSAGKGKAKDPSKRKADMESLLGSADVDDF